MGKRPLTAPDQRTVAYPQAAPALFTEQAIGRVGCGNLLCRGLAPHRQIAGNLAGLADRCNRRQNPVMVAVLAAILDHAGPRSPLLEIPPDIFKGLRRHVRMANDVVWLTDQLGFRKAADLEESCVDIGDLPLQVGPRNDQRVVAQRHFDTAYRHVGTHRYFLLLRLSGEHSPAVSNYFPALELFIYAAATSSTRSISREVISCAISVTISMRFSIVASPRM